MAAIATGITGRWGLSALFTYTKGNLVKLFSTGDAAPGTGGESFVPPGLKVTDPRTGFFKVLPGGRLSASNITLRSYITGAYGASFQSKRMSGGPDWISSTRYDIEATVEKGAIKGITERGATRIVVTESHGPRHRLDLQGLVLATAGGWVAVHWLGGGLAALSIAIGLAFVVFGVTLLSAVRASVWRR